CSAPRPSSAWAITRPISPRPSIIWSKAVPSPTSGARAIPPPSPPPWRRRNERGDAERMKANILIVEDEEALVLLLRYNLEAEGYGVDTVARGDEADLLLKERSPDLVILDWMLPGLSGIELCRRLRARPGTKRVPLLMLTAPGGGSGRVRGPAAGAHARLVNPGAVP